MRKRIVLTLLPAGLGILVALASLVGWLGNPRIHLQANLVGLSLGVGVALSLGAALSLLLIARSQQAGQQAATAAIQQHQRFLSRLDHQLKNPVQAILIAITNALHSPDPDERRAAMTTIQNQTRRIRRLIEDLRRLQTLETATLDMLPVDLGELAERLIFMIHDLQEEEGRNLSVSLPEGTSLPAIRGDYDLLIAALDRVLKNAIIYCQPGDNIQVRVFERDRFVHVEVADTGPGIPEDELPYVGEALFRGKDARGIPGAGLGLAITRIIVERHNGQLDIRSRLGEGTVVTLRFPVA